MFEQTNFSAFPTEKRKNPYLVQLFSKWKGAIRKGHASFFVFYFWELWYPSWSIAAKPEIIWTKIFPGSWPGIVWMKSICQILILPPLTCDPALFPGKNIANISKNNRIFPERGEEIKTSFWHIWIAQWLKFFRTTAYFFRFWPSKRGVKVEPKVLTLGPSLFHK